MSSTLQSPPDHVGDSPSMPGAAPVARDPHPHPRTRTMLLLAAVFGIATIITGSINSATGSGFACPTWPGCYPGQFGPEREVHDVIEFGHRLIAASTGFVLLAAAVVALRLPKVQWMARWLPWVSVAGAIVAAVVGRLVVLNLGVAKPLALFDLFGALAVLVAATLASLSINRGAPRWQWTPLSRLATACTAGLYALYLGGILVAGKGSFTAVVGWPMWRLVDADGPVWLQVARMVLAVAVAVGLVLLVRRGWRHESLRFPLAAIVVLFMVEFIVGQLMAALGVDMWWAAAHCSAAGLMLVCTTLVMGRTGLDGI